MLFISPLCRIRDGTSAQRKAEEKVEELHSQLTSSAQIHQTLTDEHHALQLAFNSVEKKLLETEKENDRLVRVRVCDERIPQCYDILGVRSLCTFAIFLANLCNLQSYLCNCGCVFSDQA